MYTGTKHENISNFIFYSKNPSAFFQVLLRKVKIEKNMGKKHSLSLYVLNLPKLSYRSSSVLVVSQILLDCALGQ